MFPGDTFRNRVTVPPPGASVSRPLEHLQTTPPFAEALARAAIGDSYPKSSRFVRTLPQDSRRHNEGTSRRQAEPPRQCR
jgi:hypothetical protein